MARHALDLGWHALGSEGEPWPDSLRNFGRACGVYAIRDRASGKVLYVGSSNGRLYDTITRHFQQWKRKKNWWKGAYGAGHDPGMTYARGRCDIRVRLTSCDERLSQEAKWISTLRPRDNLTEHPDGELEEAPF